MAKTNREKLKELQDALLEIETKANEVKEKITDSKAFIDAIAQHKTNAEQWREEIENAKNQSASVFDEIQNLKNEIDQTKEDLNQRLNAIEVKKDDIDKFFIKIFGEEDSGGKRSGGLSSRLSQKEKETDSFLSSQEKKYKELFAKIESLLTGATSIGLAKAYYEQKISYKWPIRIWAFVFIFALIGVIVTGILSFEETIEIEKSFSKLASRTPFYFALIWLAAFSSKQYRQNKRLEQEYAHKEVLAKSYQGYKTEFESQSKLATDKEVSTNLKKILVEAIRKNPSELLDDGKSDDTPSIWQKSISLFGSSDSNKGKSN